MEKVQIVYAADSDGALKYVFRDEADLMQRHGFIVGTVVDSTAGQLIYRGPTVYSPELYPSNQLFINCWEQNKKTLFTTEFYPIISDLTIDTFFTDKLDSHAISEINKRGWNKAFIKKNYKSLFAFGDNDSVWPDNSFSHMNELFNRLGVQGPYAIREFIDNKEILYDEQRYWVLNGIAFHPSRVIPDFVQEAATRLYEFSGSHYFTIDVAGDYIVEVNPGESSDRGGDNPLEFFAEIFAKTFLKS